MNISLSEKLKSLRKEKNVSQEKLAEYLGVSFQAVSKWENGNTYPDILLLSDIARFYGITIDELLQVEKIDEIRLFDEYEDKAENLYRNGELDDVLVLWKEAYKQMPNNIEVKEHLMSTYFDIDKIKYQNEIIELGNEIYNMDHPSNYYKGQVCHQLAVLYSYLGKEDLAEKWADKSFPLHHATELIYTQIFGSEETIQHVSWCMYWFLQSRCQIPFRFAQHCCWEGFGCLCPRWVHYCRPLWVHFLRWGEQSHRRCCRCYRCCRYCRYHQCCRWNRRFRW